jgi:DNA-binding CsgD family transcriptional regulator
MARTHVDGAAVREVVQLLSASAVTQPIGEPVRLDGDLLLRLQELIPCDAVVFTDYVPRQNRTWIYADTFEGETNLHGSEVDQVFFRHYWATPCSHPDRTGDYESVRILSDHWSLREWRTSPMAVDLGAVYGGPIFDRDMLLPLPSPPGHSRRVRFERFTGLDFDETDRALAALVRPLLANHLHALDLASRAIPPLTTRQRQLMNLVAAGFSNMQAARTLGISEGTVRTHLQQIYVRLGVTSRGEAAALFRDSNQATRPAPAPFRVAS